MNNSKKILILAYKFSPAGGVGTRRWIKFCKYLERSGYELFVVTGHFSKKNNHNAWEDDLKELKNLTLSPVGNKIIPQYVFSNKRNKLEKLLSYPIRAYLKFFSDGIDYAESWGKAAALKSQELINEHGITNVIATGAPFSTLVHASTLKIQNPDLNFIADLRDPWIEDFNNRRYPQKTTSHKEFNQNYRYQQQVFNCADHITTVSKTLGEMFVNNFSLNEEKVHYIPNGFDPEIDHYLETDKSSDELNIIYPGALTGGRQLAIEFLQDALIELKREGKKLPYKFHFVGSTFSIKDDSIKDLFKFHPYMNAQKLSLLTAEMDYGLVINAKGFSYLYSSKAAEFIGKGKPIILISEEGELSQIIKKTSSHHMKYDINHFKKVISELNLNNVTPGEKINRESDTYQLFDIENLTAKITKLLS